MNTSRIRQTLNAVGCVAIVLVSLFLFISLAMDLGSLPSPRPGDPDGGKAIWIYLSGIVVAALVGASASVSLLRSVKLLRHEKYRR